MAKTDAPRWRATQTSFIEHNMVLEGAEVDYTPPEGGQIAENLEPLNEAAQALVDAQKDPHPAKRTKTTTKPKVDDEPVV